VYGPVRTVVWQGSAGNRCPYADQTGLSATGNVSDRDSGAEKFERMVYQMYPQAAEIEGKSLGTSVSVKRGASDLANAACLVPCACHREEETAAASLR
jgi:hypothetical protein